MQMRGPQLTGGRGERNATRERWKAPVGIHRDERATIFLNIADFFSFFLQSAYPGNL